LIISQQNEKPTELFT